MKQLNEIYDKNNINIIGDIATLINKNSDIHVVVFKEDEKKDIEIIQSEVPDASLEKLIEIYNKNHGDIVNTIMELTTQNYKTPNMKLNRW